MRKIKICHVQLLPLLSGVQNMMINLLEHLDRSKFDITVVSAPDGPMIDKLKTMNIRHIAVPHLIQRINVNDLSVFIRFYKIFRKYTFDIVHTHSSKTGLFGRIAARLAGVKIVVHTIHGFPFHPHQSRISYLFFKNLERIAGVFCDRAISVNTYEKDLAIHEKVISRNKIASIYNGIFELKSSNPVDRSQYNIPEKHIIIGTMGRLSEPKNMINITSVAIEVVLKSDNISFVFVGDGEQRKIIEDMISQSGTSDRIHLVGWQDDIAQWYDLFDIVLLYSKWEGLSLTILEAMSMKKPLIVSNIKGNKEMVFEERNGYLVEIDDHQDLTKKIISLSKDMRKQKIFGAESYKIFLESFTIDTFIERYMEEYNDLIKKKL